MPAVTVACALHSIEIPPVMRSTFIALLVLASLCVAFAHPFTDCRFESFIFCSLALSHFFS